MHFSVCPFPPALIKEEYIPGIVQRNTYPASDEVKSYPVAVVATGPCYWQSPPPCPHVPVQPPGFAHGVVGP